VLLSGGQTALVLPTSIASAELYNPSTNTWAAAGSLTTGRSVHTATLLPSGKVLVAGGLNTAASAGSIALAELYDPATNAWTSAGAMSAPRYSHTATLLPNGKVLVVGGLNSATFATLATAELYDPSTNSWTTVNPMAGARYLHTSTLLANGKLLVMGGSGFEAGSFKTFKTAELYDPAANAWSAAAPMSVARVSHTVTLLPGDKVLVAGGFSSLDTAEIYDAATNTWAATGLMVAGRHAHAATLLNNGKVLISGGSGASAGAELF
jgi:N-acetylneuraminic acid mutarotase